MKSILALGACALLAAASLPAIGAAFSVSPLRVELGSKAKSASFTVINDGKSPISFQVSVKKWTQDASGADVYEDSKDLVVFPLQLEVPGGGKRIVRVGYEGAAPSSESAYRVFIEELPAASNPGQGRKGAVTVVGRFALPVFLKPDGAKGKLSIDDASAKGGKFSAKISNTGNSRVRVVSLAAGSAKDAAAEIANPYLMPGATREFTGPLGAACKAGAKVTLTAKSDGGLKATRDLTLPPDACS
jgi:fimbrial chaperone protein